MKEKLSNYKLILEHVSQFQDDNTIPWALVVVTVVDVGINDKTLVVVFTVANCCICSCAPPLFDLSNSIVIYALFI